MKIVFLFCLSFSNNLQEYNQHQIQSLLKQLWGWQTNRLPGQPIPMSDHLTGKDFFLVSNLNLLCLSLGYFYLSSYCRHCIRDWSPPHHNLLPAGTAGHLASPPGLCRLHWSSPISISGRWVSWGQLFLILKAEAKKALSTFAFSSSRGTTVLSAITGWWRLSLSLLLLLMYL